MNDNQNHDNQTVFPMPLSPRDKVMEVFKNDVEEKCENGKYKRDGVVDNLPNFYRKLKLY